MISEQGKRQALLALAVLFSVPGTFFAILWLGAHAFPNSIGPLVYQYPQHVQPESQLVGVIFLLAGIESLVGIPLCIMVVISGTILIARQDVSGLTKIAITTIAIISLAGTAWAASGMP